MAANHHYGAFNAIPGSKKHLDLHIIAFNLVKFAIQHHFTAVLGNIEPHIDGSYVKH